MEQVNTKQYTYLAHVAISFGSRASQLGATTGSSHANEIATFAKLKTRFFTSLTPFLSSNSQCSMLTGKNMQW